MGTLCVGANARNWGEFKSFDVVWKCCGAYTQLEIVYLPLLFACILVLSTTWTLVRWNCVLNMAHLLVCQRHHTLPFNFNIAHANDFKFLSHDRARSEYDDKTGLVCVRTLIFGIARIVFWSTLPRHYRWATHTATRSFQKCASIRPSLGNSNGTGTRK